MPARFVADGCPGRAAGPDSWSTAARPDSSEMKSSFPEGSDLDELVAQDQGRVGSPARPAPAARPRTPVRASSRTSSLERASKAMAAASPSDGLRDEGRGQAQRDLPERGAGGRVDAVAEPSARAKTIDSAVGSLRAGLGGAMRSTTLVGGPSGSGRGAARGRAAASCRSSRPCGSARWPRSSGRSARDPGRGRHIARPAHREPVDPRGRAVRDGQVHRGQRLGLEPATF